MNRAMLRGKALATTIASFASAEALKDYEIDQNVALAGIAAANIIGTGCFWLNPAFMMNKFTSSLVLNTFVHVDGRHIFANLAILSFAWPEATNLFGPHRTIALYFSGAAITSAASLSVGSGYRSKTLTVGSSGAVSSILAAVLCEKDVGPILAPTGAIGLIATSALFLKLGRVHVVDHLNHLVGFLVGSSFAILHRCVNS